MRTVPGVPVSLSDLELQEIVSSDGPWIDELYPVYPPEFGPPDREYVVKALQEYRASDAWCFAAHYDGRLAGAFWLSQPNPWYAGLNLPYAQDEYIVRNLFVVPDYRGRGISKLLLSYGLHTAGLRGVSSVLSLIPSNRPASLRAHLSVGFQLIGTFSRCRRWFKGKDSFVTAS
jgi:GNAT superfamily N-acetyltransferase